MSIKILNTRQRSLVPRKVSFCLINGNELSTKLILVDKILEQYCDTENNF